jgi:hypothetical protein
MKVVINTSWGGFKLPEEVAKKLGCSVWGNFEDSYEAISRSDERLVEAISNYPYRTTLDVVEIPDNATDWRIEEYDGMENVIAVIDGKIVDL